MGGSFPSHRGHPSSVGSNMMMNLPAAFQNNTASAFHPAPNNTADDDDDDDDYDA